MSILIESASADAPHEVIPPIGGSAPAKRLSWGTYGTCQRCTSKEDALLWRKANPKQAPENEGIPADGLTRTLYSKFPSLSPDGKLFMATLSSGAVCVYDAVTLSFLGLVPQTQFNTCNEGAEPRWSRLWPGQVTHRSWAGNAFFRHLPLVPTDQTEQADRQSEPHLIASMDGLQDAGGEGDTDWQGRYFAVKRVYDARKQVGILDLQAGSFLPGWIDAAPNGVDISPSGKWLFLSFEAGPNAVVLISTLINSGQIPFRQDIDSAVVNGVRSISHAGWAFDAAGQEHIVYLDGRDDWIKAFNPETGKSFGIVDVGAWCKPYPGFWLNCHISAIRNPACKGWALLSTYLESDEPWWSNQLMLIEMTPDNPRIVRLGHTQNLFQPAIYETQCFANIDDSNSWIYFSSNWSGTATTQIYRMNISSVWTELNQPVDVPSHKYEVYQADEPARTLMGFNSSLSGIRVRQTS